MNFSKKELNLKEKWCEKEMEVGGRWEERAREKREGGDVGGRMFWCYRPLI